MDRQVKRPSLLHLFFEKLLQRKPHNTQNSLQEQISLPKRPNNDDRDSWRDYWQQIGQFWRTEPEIDTRRQHFLDERRAITPDIRRGIYPFKSIKLSRADVEWLLATHENGRGPIDWNDTSQRTRRGLDLRGANLIGVDLSSLPLACILGGLTGSERVATATKQHFIAAAHLEHTVLYEAHLEGARLSLAHLEKADMYATHLEAARLYSAHLEGANLRLAYFDNATNLDSICLGNEQYGFASLVDVRWGDVNLAMVNWKKVQMVGDEPFARHLPTSDSKNGRRNRLRAYRRAVRANRQLAVALQSQGLSEDAARFAYRAQKLQRIVLRRQRKFLQYLFSLFLDLLAGYGYKPIRSLLWYLIVVVGFAMAYYLIGHLPLFPDSFVFSLTSFHGRGFFPGFGSRTTLHNPLVVLAAFEAVIGLFIEISFIATFTQRFFGK